MVLGFILVAPLSDFPLFMYTCFHIDMTSLVAVSIIIFFFLTAGTMTQVDIHVGFDHKFIGRNHGVSRTWIYICIKIYFCRLKEIVMREMMRDDV